MGPHRDWRGTVTEAGATPVWPHLEWAYQQWTDAGQPSWDRLGLTVTPTQHTVWLDDPAGPHRWPLTGAFRR